MRKFISIMLTLCLLMVAIPVYGVTEKTEKEEYTLVVNETETDTTIDQNIDVILKALKAAGLTVLKDDELKQVQISAKSISETYVKTIYAFLSMVPGGKLAAKAIDDTFQIILK